jgi:hypothetical protein
VCPYAPKTVTIRFWNIEDEILLLVSIGHARSENRCQNL